MSMKPILTMHQLKIFKDCFDELAKKLEVESERILYSAYADSCNKAMKAIRHYHLIFDKENEK